jgi:hypothetical protein
MRRAGRVFALLLLIACIYGGIIFFQNSLSATGKAHPAPPSMAYLPDSDKIRPWFLGFQTAFADFLWIKTTLYFGTHQLGDRQYPWLLQMVDMVTRFNPYLYPAYEFGGLVVPEIGKNFNAARIILERGVCANLEKKWKLYFYLGMVYYKYYTDYEKAALCLAIAAQLPGAPVIKLSGIAQHFINQSFGSSQAEKFLMLLYSTSENPEVRRYLLNKIKGTSTAGMGEKR